MKAENLRQEWIFPVQSAAAAAAAAATSAAPTSSCPSSPGTAGASTGGAPLRPAGPCPLPLPTDLHHARLHHSPPEQLFE